MKEFWTAERRLYAPVFRVAIGLILLIDLLTTFPSISFLFQPELNSFLPLHGVLGFLAKYPFVFFGLYASTLLLFIFGIGKHFVSFLVFVFYFFMLQFSIPFVTWGDKILRFTLLYFVFVDSFRCLSAHRSTGTLGLLSKLALMSIILHLFLIYGNNAFFKAINRDWQLGHAVFYSFSQYPNFKESIFYPIISNGSLSKWIGYLVILLQLSFVPLTIWRKTRLALLMVSTLLHVVMMFQFGLWKFEWIVILHYGFVLTDEDWKRIFGSKTSLKLVKT